MPARRAGSSAQKSASQRLWARVPAQPALVLLGLRRRRHVEGLVVEGRHRVGEDHLGHHAVALQVGAALGRVPVLGLLAADVLLRRVAVGAAPGVEVVAVLRVEVLAVAVDGGAGVGVAGDRDVGLVAVGGCRHGNPPAGRRV